MNTKSASTCAEIIASSLAAAGLEEVFIYPGGTIAPLVNAFVDCCVKVEVFKHEQGAVYAALAKARLTGKIQVAMVTSGPGVTNAITPIADAYYDSTPVLLITGQVSTADILSKREVRQRGFQEVPTVALLSPITKKSICPLTPDEAISMLPSLINLALDGRQGPVVMDLPMDVQRGFCIDLPCELLFNESRHVTEVGQVLTPIIECIQQSKRPVIMLGHGALTAGAFNEYLLLAEKVDAIVVTSLPGLGSFPATNPRFIGYIGHTGHEAANLAVHESDLLIVLGARLDVRQTGTLVHEFVPNGKVVLVNNDNDEINACRVKVAWAVNCNLIDFVDAVLTDLNPKRYSHDTLWVEKILRRRASRSDDCYFPTNGSRLFPREVLDELNKTIADDCGIVVTGVGSHQQWAARHIHFSPDGMRLLTSAGHGAMGYDIPSAIGAAIACPDRPILCIVGDGSILMNIQELGSLAERDLNVKILVLNNNRLGIVSQFQLITWGIDHASGSFGTPDFVTVAKGFGISAERLSDRECLADAIGVFWRQPGPVLLEVLISHEANVVPMLMGGQAMDKMWNGELV